MRKFELKGLAPYLPYRLNIQGQTHGDVEIMSCVTDTSVNIEGRSFAYGMWADIFDIKPILHPLSDYKNINSSKVNDLNIDLCDQMTLCDFANGKMSLQSVTVGVYQIMCENHIDFGGLIDAGLAVDINTIVKSTEKA